MHKSLQPASSLIALAVSATLMLIFAFGVSHPKKVLLLTVGGGLGAVAGVLQLRALGTHRDRFLSAKTALEVRQAMTASKAGLGAVYLIWINGALLLFIALSQTEAPLAGAVGGFAMFIFIREAISLRGCYDLQRSTTTKPNG